jgi:hypothetical protein
MTEIERIRAIVDNAKANNVPIFQLNTEDMDDLLAALDNLEAAGRPYKIYSALLNETGPNDPVATILENTIGDIVWTRSSAGDYVGTLAGAFAVNKTAVILQGSYENQPGIGNYFNVVFGKSNEINPTDVIYVGAGNTADGPSDGVNDLFIEIRVYN